MTIEEKIRKHRNVIYRLQAKLEHESELKDVENMRKGLVEMYGTDDVTEIMKIKSDPYKFSSIHGENVNI